MEPPTNPLIAAAVASLSENAENKLAATSILTRLGETNHPGAGDAIERWTKVDEAKYPFLWKQLLYIAAILFAIPMVAYQVPDLKRAHAYRNVWDAWEYPEARLPEGLTADEKLLVGDPAEDDFNRKEALYQSDPENPAFFAEYVSAHYREFGNLPDGYLETVSRIAPENSFFLYNAAGLAARGALDQKVSTTPRTQRRIDGVRVSSDPVEDDYLILDQTAFGESLALLEKASSLPEYEAYWSALQTARFRAIPKGGTFAERVDKVVLTSGGLGGITSIHTLSAVISTQAQQLSRAGDVEGFLALAETREHLIRAIAGSPDLSLLNEIIFVGSASETAEYLHYSAKRLNLDEMAEHYLAQYYALRDSAERRNVRRKVSDNSWLHERGSPLTESFDVAYRVADSPPPFSVADFAPARYADHALMMRAGLSAIAIILIFSLLIVFLFRFAFPPALRKTAARLVQLLRPVDWLMILPAGTVLPFAAIFAIQRFSEFGGREWAVNHFQYLFPGAPLTALLIFIYLVPVFLVRWRISKRIAPLGIPCRPGIMSWLALTGTIALTFAACPVIVNFGFTPLVVKALAAIPAFWLCAVLWSAVQVFIGKAPGRISLAATSMALLPAYSTAIIIAALSLPIYKTSEENWLAKDTIHNFDAIPPESGLYERRLAMQKRKETRALLGL